MTTRHILMAVALVLIAAGEGRADFSLGGHQHMDVTSYHPVGRLWDFSTADVKVGGFVRWAYVNDEASLTVSEGGVIYLHAYNSSSVIVFGGTVTDSVNAHDSSRATISGGHITSVAAYDTGNVTISGGTFWNLTALGSSTMAISGGDVRSGGGYSYLQTEGTSSVEISGGNINELRARMTSSITFHGMDFEATEGLALDGETVLGTGVLTGKWFDGTPWSLPITAHAPGASIRVILEPDTLTWDGTDPGEWTSANWNGYYWNPGPLAPSGGEPMVVDSGTVTVSSDLTPTPAGSLTIADGAAGGTVSIGPAGVLSVSGEVNVGAGGTLSIDGVLVAPVATITGGTLTSSGGVGTANVDGNLILTGGATFAVEATGAGIDRLACTGTVTLDGASLNITTGFPGPTLGHTMQLITADGGLDGILEYVDGVLQPGNKALAVTYQSNGATVTVVRPGDFEVDGDVDFSDFTYLAANYGQSGKSWVDGDCDGNGTVEFVDFTHLGANYGSDSDSSPEAPPVGAVELHVNVVTGEMRLVGSAATLSGYSITSAASSLVPDGDGDASPFQGYLANLAHDVSTFSVGVGVLVDGELALDAVYNTAGPMDLSFSYGVFGQGGSVDGSIVVVPEPTCLALLALGGVAMTRRRRELK